MLAVICFAVKQHIGDASEFYSVVLTFTTRVWGVLPKYSVITAGRVCKWIERCTKFRDLLEIRRGGGEVGILNLGPEIR